MRKTGFGFLALLLGGLATIAQGAERMTPVPVIFDTDIGTDIDDAYALAALIQRPELELLGVTTVSGDTVARARLAAKLLAMAGGRSKSAPVYAGEPGSTQYMKQVDWARGYAAPNLHDAGAVEFMRREIDKHPGQVTLIAVGELTNVAALLNAAPGIGKKIHAIALMGGSIRRGYAPGSKPEPEWNIKSNAAAARTVFTSGVPLLVAPLDSTADLRLTPEMRVELFSRGTPLNDALASLNSIWRHTNTWKAENPTLFDVLAVELVAPRTPYTLASLRVEVADDGLTQPVAGTPNAQVALEVDAAAFMRDFVARLNGSPDASLKTTPAKPGSFTQPMLDQAQLRESITLRTRSYDALARARHDCQADEGPARPRFLDADGDGHGDPATRIELCAREISATAAAKGKPLLAETGDDCDDRDPGIWHDCRRP
jgi:inosine-uridine nucleoside N-ribohydrolase